MTAFPSFYIKETSPEIEVIGVEANGARSMKAAFEAGGPVKLKEIDKFADGIAVQKVGQLTYEATRQHVQTLVGVDEGLISETLIDLYSKQGIVAEPAGAASIASLEVLATGQPGPGEKTRPSAFSASSYSLGSSFLKTCTSAKFPIYWAKL